MELIHANYEIAAPINIGSHRQIRYVQGDAPEIRVHHNGQWHRVPLGGMVAGSKGPMVIDGIYSHRATQALIEIADRVVDVIPVIIQEPAGADDVCVAINWQHMPGSGARKRAVIMAAPGESISVRANQIAPAFGMILSGSDPLPANRGFLNRAVGIGVERVGFGGSSAYQLVDVGALSSFVSGASMVRVDVSSPVIINDHNALIVECGSADWNTTYTHLQVHLLGRV